MAHKFQTPGPIVEVVFFRNVSFLAFNVQHSLIAEIYNHLTHIPCLKFLSLERMVLKSGLHSGFSLQQSRMHMMRKS